MIIDNKDEPEAVPLRDEAQLSKREELDAMFPMFYAELRRLARSRLAAGGRHTYLDTNALINESFLRIQAKGNADIKSKDHFLAYAATTMRSVVVDTIRRRNAEWRGGAVEHVTLNTEAGEMLGASNNEILDVNEALEKLALIDVVLVQVVEMKYFAGLTEDEIGRALNISSRTVGRYWDKARLLLEEILER